MKRLLQIIVLLGALLVGGQALAYTVQSGSATFDSIAGVWSIPVIATGEPRALYGFDFNLFYDPALFLPVATADPLIAVDTDFGAFANYFLKASFDLGQFVAVSVFDDGLFTPLVGGDPITLATVKFSGAFDANTGGFGVQDATLAPVPEPGTFLLLGLGLAGLVGYRRKFQKA